MHGTGVSKLLISYRIVAMQDSFLPHVENGTITLLGATTENPSFQLNSALLSRCRVIVLAKLSSANVESLLRRSLVKLKADIITCKGPTPVGREKVWIMEEALVAIADLTDGDARNALNSLQLAVQTKRPLADAESVEQLEPRSSSKHSRDAPNENPSIVTVEDIKRCLQRTHLLYDRRDQRSDCISALHKSMRGSDANASLYWLARMLCAGEDPLYVARRVINFASEDVGMHNYLLSHTPLQAGYLVTVALKGVLKLATLTPLATLASNKAMCCVLQPSKWGHPKLFPIPPTMQIKEIRSPIIMLFLHTGLADPNALLQAVAAYNACQYLGMPDTTHHANQRNQKPYYYVVPAYRVS